MTRDGAVRSPKGVIASRAYGLAAFGDDGVAWIGDEGNVWTQRAGDAPEEHAVQALPPFLIDGANVYSTGDALWVTPLAGGEPRRLAEYGLAPPRRRRPGARWSKGSRSSTSS
jgi:hypothetical protein